jgi:acetyltransferase EpsM
MSTKKKLVVIGGGEHGRVVAECARLSAEAWSLFGFVDDLECTEFVERFGVKRLGSDSALADCQDVYAILGFGSFKSRSAREVAVGRIDPMIAGWATVTHRAAFVSPTSSIDSGTVVMPGAVIQTGAKIGKHCVINSSATIEHDVVVSDYVQIGPGAVVGGGASIGRGAFVGLGASIRDHIKLGDGSVIGMGAAVVRDVAGNAVVRGVPAR